MELLRQDPSLHRDRWVLSRLLKVSPFDPSLDALTDLQREWILGQAMLDREKQSPEPDPVQAQYAALVAQDEAAEAVLTDVE